MSKIKQLNRGETLAINMVMGMDVFIKLKCKMQGKLKNRGWERNMLFWSSSLRRLEWYLLEKQLFHLPQTHKRIWQDEKCTYIIHRWLKPSIQFRPTMPCKKWAILRKQFGSCVSASKKVSGLTHRRVHTHTHTPTCTSGVWISVTLFLISGDNPAPYTLLWHVAIFFILSYRPIGCKLSMVCVLAYSLTVDSDFSLLHTWWHLVTTAHEQSISEKILVQHLEFKNLAFEGYFICV